jgi:hypothetical protein
MLNTAGRGCRPRPDRAGARHQATGTSGLQQRAQSNFRRYFFRALWRFAVLVIADLASIMRALVVPSATTQRSARGFRRGHPGVASDLEWLANAAALFISLICSGTMDWGCAARCQTAVPGLRWRRRCRCG